MSRPRTEIARALCGPRAFALTGLLALLSTGARAHGCGPSFPNQVIANGDAGVLALPAGDFAAEVDALRPPSDPPFRAQPDGQAAYSDSAKADVADLDAALHATALPPDGRSAIVDGYRHLRVQLADHLAARAASSAPAPGGQYGDVPTGLPAEFAGYVRGLIAYDSHDLPAARAAWAAVLALPAAQRHYRSTWAAYMTGRSYVGTDADRAAEWFGRTRDLVAAGFPDPIGLAAASLGWQARADLDAKRFVAAAGLYLRQAATGDPGAAMSLRVVAEATLSAGPDALATAARDPVARRVVTAYVLSNAARSSTLSDAEQRQGLQWLTAVRSAGVTDVTGADRLAWAAYRTGGYAAAAEWVARAPAGSAVAGWVRAKLLLREGKVDDAATVLAAVVRSFPTDATTDGPIVNSGDPPSGFDPVHAALPLMSDLGVLQLARGQYADALSLLLRAGRWVDAAYVAERVLTPDELRTYVDAHCPADPAAKRPDGRDLSYNEPARLQAESIALRSLLARRLTRLGRWRDARPYYTPDLQPVLDDYVYAIRSGHDSKRTAADRAASFMAAARLARSHGMDLLGTELDPDFHCWAGGFEVGGAERPRGEADKLTRPSADELARWKASAPADPRRWQYRYTAADHAWSAAALLPDDSPDTAAVLYEAGCWLKDRDPKGADRFYRALVKRCPTTELGRQAAALHWFPKPSEAR